MKANSGLFQRGGIYKPKVNQQTPQPTYFLLMTSQPNVDNMAWFASVSYLNPSCPAVPGCNECQAFYNLRPYSINTHGTSGLDISVFQKMVNSTPIVTLSENVVNDIAKCIITQKHIMPPNDKYLF